MSRLRRPRIVIRGAPEWIITFGDMATLLLTFFILLFSVAQMKDTGKVYDLIYALQGVVTGKRPVHGFLLPSHEGVMDDARNETDEPRRDFGEAGVHPRPVPDPEGAGMHAMKSRDHLHLTLEGSVLFGEGSSRLEERGKQALDRLLVPRFRDGPFRIVIRGSAARGEGSTPLQEDDLGFARAREVRDYFVGQGIPPRRFELQTRGSRGAAEGPAEELGDRGGSRQVEIFVSPESSEMDS